MSSWESIDIRSSPWGSLNWLHVRQLCRAQVSYNSCEWGRARQRKIKCSSNGWLRALATHWTLAKMLCGLLTVTHLPLPSILTQVEEDVYEIAFLLMSSPSIQKGADESHRQWLWWKTPESPLFCSFQTDLHSSKVFVWKIMLICLLWLQHSFSTLKRAFIYWWPDGHLQFQKKANLARQPHRLHWVVILYLRNQFTISNKFILLTMGIDIKPQDKLESSGKNFINTSV